MAQRRLVDIGQTLAIGFVGAIAVYVGYYPSDSIAVENGDALWLAVLGTVWISLVGAVLWPRQQPGFRLGFEWIDCAAGGLAAWMMAVAFLNAGQSDLRMGTNEAWWWVTAAAVFITGRRVLSSVTIRQAFLLVIVCVSIGLAVDALHQDWISLPALRASFLEDPDAIIAKMGMDAPPGSSARMVLENRLMDGGPTATFALANSLAALLLLGVIVVAGGLKFAWSKIGKARKAGLLGCLLVLFPALIAVRSRAALAATLFGLVMLWVVDRSTSTDPAGNQDEEARNAAQSKPKQTNNGVLGLIGIAAVGIVGLIGLAMFGNPEWFNAAPASLTFRLRYWAATWRMMTEHALLGAGPGNFQSLYDRYRDVSTTEQIADPHNFLWETLSSGGPIALMLLLVVFALAFQTFCSRPSNANPEGVFSTRDHRIVLFGGTVMLVLIWFLGLLTLHSPDVWSHLFAVPIAIGFGWAIRLVYLSLDAHQVDGLFLVGIFAMLIHLSVSGGWTVPGVAFWAWMLLAGLARVTFTQSTDGVQFSGSKWPISIGLLALLLLTFQSVRPVAQRRWLMSEADASLRLGNVGKSERLIAEAVDSDQWSSSATLLQSEFLCHEIIRQKSRPAVRRAYEQCIEVLLNRSGPNPSVYRKLAIQRLHLYQVFGLSDDLDQAERNLQIAWEGSPADQWLVAQLAEIAIAKKSPDAKVLAKQARTLSEIGTNMERAMHLQLLYIAESIGPRAASQPLRVSAKDRFLQYDI